MFNAGAVVGSIFLGWLMQRRRSVLLLLTSYVGVAAGLLALASVGKDLVVVLTAVAAIGGFLLGAQYILYGLTPEYYRIETRGTGTGAAVAASRLGSATGPLLAGVLLGAGASASHVLQALLPITGGAALAAVLLLFLKPARST
jgi:AAHS family 3-hydroxyphenylpropionic acid transporter